MGVRCSLAQMMDVCVCMAYIKVSLWPSSIYAAAGCSLLRVG